MSQVRYFSTDRNRFFPIFRTDHPLSMVTPFFARFALKEPLPPAHTIYRDGASRSSVPFGALLPPVLYIVSVLLKPDELSREEVSYQIPWAGRALDRSRPLRPPTEAHSRSALLGAVIPPGGLGGNRMRSALTDRPEHEDDDCRARAIRKAID